MKYSFRFSLASFENPTRLNKPARRAIIVNLRRVQLPFEDVGRKFDHSWLGCLQWSGLNSVVSLAPKFEKFARLSVEEFHAFFESDSSDYGKSDGNRFWHRHLAPIFHRLGKKVAKPF